MSVQKNKVGLSRGRVWTLAVLLVLALASLTAYLVLCGMIADGERQLADGRQQLDKGRSELAAGMAELKAGKKELSEGKKEYSQTKDNPFWSLADWLFNGGRGFKDARKQIAKGDEKVAKGEDKVAAGEKQIDAGAMELSQGMATLRLARKICSGCAIGAALLAALVIVLGFCWRRSLLRHAQP